MTKKELFQAIHDVPASLYVDDDCDDCEDYNAGVGDALEAVLRHLGLYQEYEVWERSNVR